MENKYKMWFNGVEYDTMICSERTQHPRGEFYSYALLKDGNIVTFGREQGNYSGGVEAETAEEITKYCISLSKSTDPVTQRFYEILKQSGAIK